MNKITGFEDILGWQKAQDLAVAIYMCFGTIRDYGFRDQLFRAVVSISNNIAEGFERQSDREFSRFLNIAQGPCSEVRSMLYLANRLNYIEARQAEVLLHKCKEVSRLIKGFHKYLSRCAVKPDCSRLTTDRGCRPRLTTSL